MARDRARKPATTRLPPDDAARRRVGGPDSGPENPLRRALIALAPFSLGAAVALPRHGPASASAIADDDQLTKDEGRTAHQSAYYDRARF